MVQKREGRKQFVFVLFLFMILLSFTSIKAEASWKQNQDGTYSWYNKSGHLAKSKWIKGTYYVDENGIRVTGRHQIEGKYYYFNKKGELQKKRWIKSGSRRYYARKSGVLASNGIRKVNGYSYCFNKKGTMLTGKQVVKGKTYYFNESNGRMVKKQWVKIGKYKYYFGSDGVMATDKWVGRYYVGSNGKRLKNQWKGKRYLGSDGKCYSGLQTVDGKTYYFDPNNKYRKVTSSTRTINGKTYVFDSDGVGTLDSTEDEELLAAIIYCEAGNQSYTGQVAVGYVVMNRVKSSSYPNNLHDVIYQSGQFEPTRNGSLASALKNNSATSSCVKAAKEVLTEYASGTWNPKLTVNGKTYSFKDYLFFMTASSYKSLGMKSSYLKIGDHYFMKTWQQ